MHQAYADGADVLLAEKMNGRPDAGFVKRAQLVALEVEPAPGLSDETQWHDSVRLHPEVRISITLGYRLAGDFQDVPKALGDNQPERVDLPLQQSIGRNRRAMS